MNRQDVAVIIVCYNLGRTLVEAVDSVVRQSLQPAETLIVDDGSTDLYTQQVLGSLERAGHPTLRLPNRGVSAARNVGIAHTRSPLVVLLDADDWLDPRYLEATRSYLDAHADLDFVSTGMRGFGGSCYVWAPQQPELVASMTRGVVHSSTLLRRRVWETVGGYDEAWHAFEELDFWTRVMAAGFRGHVIEEPLLNYRVREGSLYHTAIDEQNHAHLMERFYEKHRLLIDAHFEEVLLAKDAFIIEQDDHYAHVVGLERDARNDIAALQQRIDTLTLQLRTLGSDRVDWGQLRRRVPFSEASGLDRGVPINQYYVERFFERHQEDIRGRVLELDGDDVARRFGGTRVDSVDVLRVEPRSSGTLRINGESIAAIDGHYDCLLLRPGLTRIFDLGSLIDDVARLVRPGGVVLCTAPALTRLGHDEHALDQDYWRFTEASIRRLFSRAFPPGAFTIAGFGNALTAAAGMYGLAAGELTATELAHEDPYFPVLYGVRATASAAPTT